MYKNKSDRSGVLMFKNTNASGCHRTSSHNFKDDSEENFEILTLWKPAGR
jgi:hypothetical protein